MIHLIRKFINTGNTALNVLIEEGNEDIKSELSAKVGSTGDTGGSATAGTIMGKLNKIISDLATHMGRWTNTRAGYIDTINTNASNLNSRLTSTRAGYLDKLNSGVPVSTLKGKIIKSVQRGSISFNLSSSYAGGSGTATLSAPVDVNKSIVIYTGMRYPGDPSQYHGGARCYLELINSTTVRATGNSYVGYDTIVPYQVIEFY